MAYCVVEWIPIEISVAFSLISLSRILLVLSGGVNSVQKALRVYYADASTPERSSLVYLLVHGVT